jgi:hypothetical protein
VDVESSGKNSLVEWRLVQHTLHAFKIISYVALARRNLHSLTKLIKNILQWSLSIFPKDKKSFGMDQAKYLIIQAYYDE